MFSDTSLENSPINSAEQVQTRCVIYGDEA